MDYRDNPSANQSNYTNIYTKIDKDLSISSIYRRYENPYFEKWSWETLLFNDGELEEQYDCLDSADQVVNLHAEIINKYKKEQKQ